MTNRELGLVGREKLARFRSEQRRERMEKEAPARAAYNWLLAKNRIGGTVARAELSVREAETVVNHWTEALARYKHAAGLDASPREVNDIRTRIDLAGDVLATRRHELAAAKAELAALVPYEPAQEVEQPPVEQPAIVKKAARQ